MTHGGTLFSAYWAQHAGYVRDGLVLWLEADTWGKNIWLNKVAGGHDLSVVASRHGTVDGAAVVATKNSNVLYGAPENIIGDKSFTVECYIMPSTDIPTLNNDGAWLWNQRTSPNRQNGAVQALFYKRDGIVLFGCSGWSQNGVLFNGSANFIEATLGRNGYYCISYDDSVKILYQQIDETILPVNVSSGVNCTVADFKIGGVGWSNSDSLNQYIGGIYSIRVHSRALDSAERAHNRAVDLRRFE
jgi:hypothetical protein